MRAALTSTMLESNVGNSGNKRTWDAAMKFDGDSTSAVAMHPDANFIGGTKKGEAARSGRARAEKKRVGVSTKG